MADFEHLEELVVGLKDRGEFWFAESPDGFKKIKSGRMSPTLFNGRGLMSFSPKLDMPIERQMRVADLSVMGYAHAIDQTEGDFDHLVNLPQAVNPIIGAVAREAGVSLLYLRTREGDKGYGSHAPVEGVFEVGDMVRGVDNVVSNAATKDEVLEPLEDGAELVVAGFDVFVDREEGGEAAIRAGGRDLNSVIGMRAATQILLANDRIRPEQAEWSFEYIDRYQVPVETS